MNFIKEINIHVKTNAKPTQSNENTESDEKTAATSSVSNDGYSLLTYNMIYQPSNSKKIFKSGFHNSKPFFTNYIEYTGSLKSYLLSRGYDEILKFFFNKSHFRYVLSEIGIDVNPSITIDKMNEYSSQNIKIMIDLLFPTSFPSINNSISSYNQLFDESAGFTPSNIMDYLPKPLKNMAMTSNKYSYVKIGGKVQTVYRIVLINDIMNHPKFNFLIKTVNRFYKKFRTERNDVIKGLITRFLAIENVFQEIEGELFMKQARERDRKNRFNNPDYDPAQAMGEITEFKDGTLVDRFNFILTSGTFKKDTRSILTGIFNNNEKQNEFDKLKKALEEILPVSNTREQIKKYLIYYEIFTKYYQFDNEYKQNNKQPPILKYIYYNKSNDSERNSNDLYSRRNYLAFDIEKEAKKQIQSDNIMSEYRRLFDAFKQISFDKILTDNNKFNEIIKSYVYDLDTPDNFLLYLYNILSLLHSRSGSIQSVFTKYSNLDNKVKEKIKDVANYCKMTVVNSFDKTESGSEKPTNYEVYIHLDLIDGEVNDTNLSMIKCKYRGKQLGEMYQQYMKPFEFWEIKPLPFLRINDILEKNAKIKNPGNADVNPIQGGKRNKTRRLRLNYIRKTRKYRY